MFAGRAGVQLDLRPTAETVSLKAVVRYRPVGDAHQVGDGTHTHLRHHAPAVHLDRLLDGAEIAGDLLIEPTRHHVGEHFALARRELRDPRLDRAAQAAYVPALHVTLEGAAHGRDEKFGLYRLGQEVHRAGLHGTHARRDVALAGHEDDRPLDAVLDQRHLQLQAVERRHRHVEQGAARHLWVVLGEKFSRRLERPRLDVGGVQDARHRA